MFFRQARTNAQQLYKSRLLFRPAPLAQSPCCKQYISFKALQYYFRSIVNQKMSCGMLMKLPITNAASNCLFNKHLCPTKQANFVYLTLHEKKQFCKLFENKNCVKMKSNVSTKDFPQNQWTAVGRCKLCGNSFLSVSSVWHKNAFPVLPLLTWIKVHPKKMPNWNTIE